MTGNKKVLCKVCYKEMRSDVLNRHMKVHETTGGSKRTHNKMEEEDVEALKKYLMKSNNEYEEKISLAQTLYLELEKTNDGSKRKHDEMEEETKENLRKYVIKKINDYKEEKIALGKRVYRILGQGKVLEESLPGVMKDALNIYMKHAHEFHNYAHCYYKNANKKHMKKEDARKGDISVDEVRNIINDGIDGLTEYMMMKLQSTEVEDEERIEESLNVFKHYMLHKINE